MKNQSLSYRVLKHTRKNPHLQTVNSGFIYVFRLR